MLEVAKQYRKAIVGALGVILSAILVAYLGDGIMSAAEFANVVILGAGTVSLGIAPNTPYAKYTKALLAAVAAAATVIVSVYTGGITAAEWAQIGVAVATALGVYQTPNVSAKKVST